MLDAVVPFPFFVEPGIKIRQVLSQNFSSVLGYFNHDICIDLHSSYAIWSVEFLYSKNQNQAGRVYDKARGNNIQYPLCDDNCWGHGNLQRYYSTKEKKAFG